MKGYKKQLEEFIGYILNRYQKDKRVSEFKGVYEKQSAKRERQKQNSSIKNDLCEGITISAWTANFCKSLVNAELDRARLLRAYSDKFILDLTMAQKELRGDYLLGLLHKINR